MGRWLGLARVLGQVQCRRTHKHCCRRHGCSWVRSLCTVAKEGGKCGPGSASRCVRVMALVSLQGVWRHQRSVEMEDVNAESVWVYTRQVLSKANVPSGDHVAAFAGVR